MSEWVRLIVEFGENLALLISLVFFYGLLIREFYNKSVLLRSVVSGALSGGIGLIVMNLPIHVAEGVIVDGRTIIVMLAGAFAGPVSGILAGALVAGFRIYLGGIGATAGVGEIVSAMLVGIAYHHYYSNEPRKITVNHLLAMSLALIPVSLLWVFALPDSIAALPIVLNLSLPLGIFYPVGTMFLGFMLVQEHKRQQLILDLRNSESRFRDFAEEATDWFWELDADLRYTFISDTYQEITGTAPETIYGKTRREMYTAAYEDERQAWAEFLDLLDSHQSLTNFTHSYAHRDGRILILKTNARAVFDEEGTFTGYRGTGLDITEQKHAEKMRDSALAEAERASRAKSEFLASMSHELRTPMNAVLGYAQMMKYDSKNPLTEAQHTYVESILSGGNHLLELVNEVLDLAKIESDQLILELTDVNLTEIVEECVGLITPLGSNRKIQIIDHFRDKGVILVCADKVRLMQCVINLLSNAVNYNNEGGTVTVVGMPTQKGFYRLSISDTGIGIAKEDHASVFAMFHRIGANPMIAREGTGIGLNVTKLLVDKMGGRIGFESELDNGSTFWIELQLASNDDIVIQEDVALTGAEE